MLTKETETKSACIIQRHLVKLSRNQNRHIESMIVGKKTYRFSLDKDGDVLKVKY